MRYMAQNLELTHSIVTNFGDIPGFSVSLLTPSRAVREFTPPRLVGDRWCLVLLLL